MSGCTCKNKKSCTCFGEGIEVPQGPSGVRGLSAYEIWLELGNTGTEQDFIDSLVGPQGPQGVPGADGANGADGADGANGADGAPGLPGADGVDGANGADGKPGLPGADGADGVDGLSFYQGLGVPSAELGNNGDSFLDTSTGDIYHKVLESWIKTGNVYLGSIAGQEHLFNAAKLTDQDLQSGTSPVQLTFADDSSAGRFDYGNTWVTNVWTANDNLTDVSFGYIINLEVFDVDAVLGATVNVVVLVNGVPFDTEAVAIPAGTVNGTLFNVTKNTAGTAFSTGDLVTVEINTIAASPFKAVAKVGSVFFNTQL